MIHTIDLVCRQCTFSIPDAKDSDYRYEDGEKRFPYCPECGTVMKHGMARTTSDYCHISDSLAIHPDQIPAHRKRFPDVEVLPDGRPKFNSVRQQQKYANACGFEKQPQKHWGIKGRRIA